MTVALYELTEQANELAQLTLRTAEAQEVNTQSIKGIDPRAAYTLMVSRTFVAIELNQDRNLRHYAGFEYIEDGLRMAIGSWVFYFLEDDQQGVEPDSRIERIIHQVYPELCPEEDEEA